MCICTRPVRIRSDEREKHITQTSAYVQKPTQRTDRSGPRQHGRAIRILHHDGDPRPVPAGEVRLRRHEGRLDLLGLLLLDLHPLVRGRHHRRQDQEFQGHDPRGSAADDRRLRRHRGADPHPVAQSAALRDDHLHRSVRHRPRQRSVQRQPPSARRPDVRQRAVCQDARQRLLALLHVYQRGGDLRTDHGRRHPQLVGAALGLRL